MPHTAKRYLASVQRLGKAERNALRSYLQGESEKSAFTRQIAVLVDEFKPTSAADLEDMFIFGVQIADVWSDDEMVLHLRTLSPAACVFFHGFTGYTFAEALHERAMRRLEEAEISVEVHSEETKRASRPKNAAHVKQPSRKRQAATVQLHRQAA